MAEDRLQTLEARVAALEAGRRRTVAATLAWGGAVLLGIAALAQGARAQAPEPPETVEAREFILHDGSGTVLFHVYPGPEGAVLELRSRDGSVTARLPWEAALVPVR